MNDNGSKEDRIREQAHLIWQSEGCPEGRAQEHWEQAERDIERIDKLQKEDESVGSAAAGAPLGPGQA